MRALSDEELQEILRITEEIMREWLEHMGEDKTLSEVYQRSGQPCPRCGTEIEFFRQDDRVTYACPNCQT
jgi:formamidopyrimidine-DNA glycosylase